MVKIDQVISDTTREAAKAIQVRLHEIASAEEKRLVIVNVLAGLVNTAAQGDTAQALLLVETLENYFRLRAEGEKKVERIFHA